MSPLLSSGSMDDGMKPRRPRPGVLRRERRALLETRAEALQDVGGLLVEMYRRGKFRRDVLSESCAAVLGIDTRLAEIDDLLQHGGGVPRCECGSPGVPRHPFLPQLRPPARSPGRACGGVREHGRRSPAAPRHR